MTVWGLGEWRRRRNGIVASLLIVCFSFASVSCFSDRDATRPVDDTGECTIPLSAIGLNKTVVVVRDFTFFPDTIRVRPGTDVYWVNCETTVSDYHTSTSATGLWTSGALNRGEFYARRFDAAGQFGYFCEPHPFMQGAVIVQ
jgi:plastocyanin